MNEPPTEELMKKLSKIMVDFPNGFVIFLPPDKEGSTWVGAFRYNPKQLRVVDAIYQQIAGDKMYGGSQN